MWERFSLLLCTNQRGVPGLEIHRVEEGRDTGCKVPLSGDVRLGGYRRPGDLISYDLITCLTPELTFSLAHYS